MRRVLCQSWGPLPPAVQQRHASAKFAENVKKVRNIGISAHIDSGKTTLTERILFYTGRINTIHEVKGATDVGATMDSMELEKERGITIRSAATYCKWKDTQINLIDTPGHVDFTIEVERSLRVLDGAVLLLCGVSGVQSQTLTVDRQMKRYGVPRVCFINKLDRDNANPQRALKMAQEKLGINAAFTHINIGISQDFEGVVDVMTMKAYYFEGKHGEKLKETEVPEYMKEDAVAARKELVARLADCDEVMEEHFLSETDPTVEELYAAIRTATIANKFVPVMCGSAYRNKGVQLLLDAVERFLPTPPERRNVGYEMRRVTDEDGATQWQKQNEVVLKTDDEEPLVAMIFKLEKGPAGMVNYVRIYQGKLRKSDQIANVRTSKLFTPPKLVRMHSNRAEQVDIVNCGEICAIVGDIGASSGDSIMKSTGASLADKRVACEDMYVPPRVLSVSVSGKDAREERLALDQFKDFMREDPTFRATRNQETDQMVLEGMGELHIDIYVERLKREFDLHLTVGKPTVNYREVITKAVDFDYIHKRQSGGAGQWAHLKGRIEPHKINMSTETGQKNKLVLKAPNGEIREQLQKSFAKTFDMKIFQKGQIIQAPVWGVKVSLLGGGMHEVDSTDMAFKTAAQCLWDEFLPQCAPTLVEPWMNVEINAPAGTMSDIVNEFTRREGVVLDSAIDGPDCTIRGETALDTMFGFIIDLRKLTKGQGDFSMEFQQYRPMPVFKAQPIIDERNEMLHRKSFTLVE